MADVTRAESQLQEIVSNITILKATLANVMGVARVSELDPVSIDVVAPNLEETHYTQDLQHTQKIQAANLQIDKSQKMLEKTEALYYPKIGFNAYYGINSGVNDSTNPNSGDFKSEDVWQVGVDLKWNVFDFGATKAANQKSKIAKLQTQLAKVKTQQDLQKSLTEALSKIQLALTNYENAQTELTLMQETLKIEKIRYESGASDINDLLYTQARYQMAHSGLIDATFNYQNALNYLNYILEKGHK
jgi:outer membrane protein TolC